MLKPFWGNNVDTVDAVASVARLREVPWVIEGISGYTFHIANVLPGYTRTPPLVNPYEAWVTAGVFPLLGELGLTTWSLGECVEGWDPYGDSCRERVVVVDTSIKDAGGRLWGICADSPFTKALGHGNLAGYTWLETPDGRVVHPDEGYTGPTVRKQHSLQTIAACVSNAVREAHEHGLEFVLVENLGKLPIAQLLEGVRLVRDEYGQTIDGFEWDAWPDRINPGLGAANQALHDLGVTVVSAIVHGGHMTNQPIQDQTDYARTARANLKRWEDVPHLDRYTCISWDTVAGQGDAFETNNNLRWVPAALPETDPTSHLAILRAVIEASHAV